MRPVETKLMLKGNFFIHNSGRIKIKFCFKKTKVFFEKNHKIRKFWGPSITCECHDENLSLLLTQNLNKPKLKFLGLAYFIPMKM